MAAPLTAVALLAWSVFWVRYRYRSGGSRGRWALEAACLVWVQAVGIFAAWPFVQGTHIGSGDAYHYLLQMADAVTQFRQGVFPAFVGQSDYAFNGGVHTIRTAPYYLHLGGLIDLFTGRRLDFSELKNLAVLLSTLGGALTAYYAVRRVAPQSLVARRSALGAYVTSAGLLAPLYRYDMLATVLIAPWQPLFWLGTFLSLKNLNDTEDCCSPLPRSACSGMCIQPLPSG